MSDLEENPTLALLEPGQPCIGVEVLTPREVPLGGPRAMTVYRTLPQKQRSLVG
ncbi:MAG: pirin family protein, partial [Actinobacteria bacterium]|nr:pirin family protein [Actinomycetota bacterium]